MKTTLVLLIAFGLNCLEMAANAVVKDTIPYVNGDCQQTDDFSKQNVSFRLQGDTLYIEGWLAANYCGEHYLAYEQWDDSIAIQVCDKYEDDVPCVVNCLYPVKAQIGDCNHDYYKINIQNHIVGDYGKNAIVKRQYQPVLTGDTVRWSFLGDHISGWGYANKNIIAWGDTIIHGLHYKYLGEALNSTPQPSCDFECMNEWWQHQYFTEIEPDIFGTKYFIRESADYSKLYLYRDDTEQDYLLSDMNVNEGDVLTIETYSEGTKHMTVDSVYMEGELKYIRFKEELAFISPHWQVESMGPNSWIAPDLIASINIVNCFKNDTFFYKDVFFDASTPCGCDQPSSNVEYAEFEKPQIFISHENIRVIFESVQYRHMILYRMDGEIVHECDNSFAEISIPTKNILPGIYLLRIGNPLEVFVTEKIIIP